MVRTSGLYEYSVSINLTAEIEQEEKVERGNGGECVRKVVVDIKRVLGCG